ncbi:membrane-associated protein, putative [Bodo saltans]|uniref:Membrane-associated protein, putative n=1 Tax=Bodo saltans TaxID=75058 RepID=A0A0S4JN67_BODSA|nr:membrane-associated protein, putative [Bodo saltans]|eukprot:CUG92928.1 membrane-associated protein, putative [Bodo saltans]
MFRPMSALQSNLIVLCLVALLLGVVVSPVAAWSHGDLVPVNVYLRINGSYPSTPSTTIPYDFCPRFGWNKLVEIPSADYGSNETDIAIRFEIGRGVNRQTKWMPLKELPSPTNGIKTAKHLTMVIFYFGFQVGAFGRFTSFKAVATYSEHAHEVIIIKYEWDEHRSYNPHIALGVVSAVSLVGFLMLVHKFTSDASKSPSTITVVRDRMD